MVTPATKIFNIVQSEVPHGLYAETIKRESATICPSFQRLQLDRLVYNMQNAFLACCTVWGKDIENPEERSFISSALSKFGYGTSLDTAFYTAVHAFQQKIPALVIKLNSPGRSEALAGFTLVFNTPQ